MGEPDRHFSLLFTWDSSANIAIHGPTLSSWHFRSDWLNARKELPGNGLIIQPLMLSWGGFIIRTITLEESSDGGSDKPFPKRRFSARFSKDGVCRGRRVVLVVTGNAFLHTL